MSIAHGGGSPPELIRWSLAERYGWTLDYIDALSVATLHEWLQIEDGRGKAQEHVRWLKK